MNLLDRTLGALACDIPGATRIFRQHRLDFCCGGDRPLREAAVRRGLDPAAVATELASLHDAPSTRDWRAVEREALIDHITARYHARHREQLPELARLAARVEQVHGGHPDCPTGLAAQLAELHAELEEHMQKEERILFPLLARGAGAQAAAPVAVMRAEHVTHGAGLDRIATLAHELRLPAAACGTWRALYAGLAQFRDDLIEHIHLENNVLFAGVEGAGRHD